MITYASTSTKLVTENYPYGYTLKTTKYDWLEFKKGKGFRHMSQTINPKTGRLNAPKADTYYKIGLLGRNEQGHVKYAAWNVNGTESINKSAKFMFEHFDHFTPAQIEEIALMFFTMMKVDNVAAVQYCGAKFEDLKPFYEVAIKAVVQIAKDPSNNLFDFINLDEEGIKSTHVPDYNPFVITYSGPISLTGLSRPQ